MNSREIRIVELLTAAFQTNRSVNFIVKQDRYRDRRMNGLMRYSLWMSNTYGKTILSDDEQACMLLVDPKLKRTSLRGISWKLFLVTRVIGLFRLRKVLKRENSVQHKKPQENYIYLWFIGVAPESQGNGLGSKMIKEFLADPWRENRPVYLETSNASNFPFYEKLGFSWIGSIESEGYTMRQYWYSDSL